MDKYIQSSPYAYCDGNPLRIIDPNGMDWYQSEDGTAVCWKKGDAATINVGNEVYKNIGETYEYMSNEDNITYSYHQDELYSMGRSVMSEEHFISQYSQASWGGTPASQACQKACDAMLQLAGFKSLDFDKSNVLVENLNGYAGGALPNATQIIGMMTENLYNGYPSKISVDTGEGGSHADGIGNHFIVVMAVTEYLSKGMVTGTSYRFFDPGTKHKTYGAGNNAVLYLLDNRLVGNAPYGSHRSYIATSIRLCQ